MNPPVIHVRIDVESSALLTRLKRQTGIPHWNALARLAFGFSIADKDPLSSSDFEARSGGIEMDYDTFSGGEPNLFIVVLLERMIEEGVSLDPVLVEKHFRGHLRRGISLLSSKASKLEDLVALFDTTELS